MTAKPKADRERQLIADALTEATFGMLKVRLHGNAHYLVIQSDSLAMQCSYLKDAKEAGVRKQLAELCEQLGAQYTRLSKVLASKRRQRRKGGGTT